MIRLKTQHEHRTVHFQGRDELTTEENVQISDQPYQITEATDDS